jgi:hypothetical protein
MQAVARQVDEESLPDSVAKFATPGQVFITAGRRYEVHAIAVFDGRASFQVVDDLRYPAWYPAWLFDVTDSALPPDWICNVFREEPALVIGPEFVARDLAAYQGMVELFADKVDLFWKRVGSSE